MSKINSGYRWEKIKHREVRNLSGRGISNLLSRVVRKGLREQQRLEGGKPVVMGVGGVPGGG